MHSAVNDILHNILFCYWASNLMRNLQTEFQAERKCEKKTKQFKALPKFFITPPLVIYIALH